MTKHQKTTVVLAAVAIFGWTAGPVQAQNVGKPETAPGAPPQTPAGTPAPAPAEPAPAAPAAPAPAEPTPTVAPAAPAPEGTPPPPSAQEGAYPGTVFPAPEAAPKTKRQKRTQRQLKTTVGMDPPEPDFGSEADLVSTADEDAPAVRPKKWVYSMKGFLRAPMRIGFGPHNDQTTPGKEAHSPPRTVGLNSDDWNYVGLTPAPTAQLHVNVSNANVSGNLIIAAGTFFDSGYKNLDQIGGVSQGYVTLTAPDLFGKRGGIAWTIGSFSNRYGVAGANQNSTGYYGTYLFGRTHTAGESLTADIDLTDDLELIVEDGFGAKLEFLPFITLSHNPPPPRTAYLPDQGPVPVGSNFVHHAHIALVVNDWLRIATHYMTSWTPNDGQPPTGYTLPEVPPPEGRLTVLGGEIHVDSPGIGNGFVGYSHIKAKKILSLADGVQVIHGSSGLGFKQNYFGRLHTAPVVGAGGTPIIGPEAPFDDSGTVDTVAGQYSLKLSSLLGTSPQGPDVALAVYGMLNHVTYFDGRAGKDVTVDKYKFGTELEISPIKFLSIGARFDRVAPDGHNAEIAYSAISPRVIVHTNYLSREYVILNYTHYFLGSQAIPVSPNWYDTTPPYKEADPDLIMLSAVVSF